MRKIKILGLRLLFLGARLFWRLAQPITLGVRLMLVRDGKVLLVRHTYQRGWYLPGGALARGETLPQAARREAAEEVGAVVRGEPRLLGVYTLFSDGRTDHEAVFVCEDFDLGSAPTTPLEIEAAAFFPLDRPPPDLAPGYGRRLQDYGAGGAAK